MNYRSNESKIAYSIITILIVIQIAVFFALRANNHAAVQSTIQDELITGTEVFNQLIKLRSQQLQQAAQILCKDFGFREAISTRDKPTIESMLINHSERASASISILSDLNQAIIATSPSNIKLDSNFVAEITSKDTRQQNELNFVPITMADPQPSSAQKTAKTQPGEIYQLINTPILSPLHFATLTLGFPIDDAYAHELKKVIDMDFLFFSHENGAWHLHASTLSPEDAKLFTPLTLNTKQINTNTEQYLSKPIMLQSASNKIVFAVAAKPMSKLMQPFTRFENVLIYLLLVTISLSAIVIYFVTKKMVRPLNDLAHLDNLTGLGNRRLFSLSLDNAFKELHTLKKPFSLMVMDLNKFKQINDTKGHDAGDIVLQATAKRLKGILRDSDSVIRLGGDEFAIVLNEVNVQSIQAIAEKISAAINQPIAIENDVVSVGVSIGIASAPSNANNKAELIKKADEAMYSAKTQQKNVQFYTNI